MKTVPLGGKHAAGRVALVDDEDYDLVSQYHWYVIETLRRGRPNGPYARAVITGHSQALMHNLIMGYKGIDHIDGNGLNNQRSNLRPATPVQNKVNQRPRVDCVVSQYKGVFRVNKGRRRWGARICVDGAPRILGYFDDEESAARAYDAAALETWGEYAYLNFRHCSSSDQVHQSAGVQMRSVPRSG